MITDEERRRVAEKLREYASWDDEGCLVDCQGGVMSAPLGKRVLDPCCGGREFYFSQEGVLFCDASPRVATLCDGRLFECAPDFTCDVCSLPFGDGSFDLVVFDPPHLRRGKGWQAEKYGTLPDDWEDFLTRGFSECWRVLREGGTLVFKWSDVQLGLSDIRPCFPCDPLFGNRRPRSSKTHWLVFYKERGRITDGTSDR